MNEILIIGEYPNKENIKDGMIRRIKEIDNQLIDLRREYLNVKFFKNFRSSKLEVDKLITVYNLNFFVHYFVILNITKKYNHIYIHSLLNYSKIFFAIKNKQNIILDTHGIVVEEMQFYNKKIKARILNILEKKLFKELKVVIFVSEKMKEFYLRKYKILKNKKMIVYPVLDREIKIEKSECLENGKVTFIYSGNLQKWQNIDLMLECVKKIENDNYTFIFLTKDIEEFQKKIDFYKIKNYFLKSVQPEELEYYYKKSHYGFLLRDDHILNRVSNPTKLSEYLAYGIVPILKLEDIGDYKSKEYEYLKVENLSKNLNPRKSFKNQEIIESILEKSKINLIEML